MRLAVAMFMAMSGVDFAMIVNVGSAIVSEERHEQQPKHVKRCEQRGNGANQPVGPIRLPCFPEDLVLAPETGERRDSRYGQCGDAHSEKCPGYVGTQAAHLAHVLLASHSMNHRACGQE